jgi:hypothetical protein
VAGLAAVGVGASALSPDEAEAGGIPLLRRADIARAVTKATKEGAADVGQIFRELNAIGRDPEHLLRGGNILDHVILDRTGKLETQRSDAATTLYPELGQISPPRPIKGKDVYGGISVPSIEVGGKTYYDPARSKLFINPELKEQAGEAALLSHEAQHMRDKLKFPQSGSREYAALGSPEELSNYADIVNSNPELKQRLNTILSQRLGKKVKNLSDDLLPDDISDVMLLQKSSKSPLITLGGIEIPQLATGKHHIEYPRNFEWEKTSELLNKGVISPSDAEVLKLITKSGEEFKQAKQSLGKKAAGLAAAGVGASALSSKEAKADEPTSSTKDESTPTSPALGGPELRGEKSGLSEEEYEKQKASALNALEKIGVFGRRMAESGTAGLSEHAFARPWAGLVNMIATAGKDNPLTWDERFMRGMQEDQEYYKKAKERQLGATAAGDLAGIFWPTKLGGVVNAGFSAAHKAANAIPLLNKAREAKGLIGAGANIATHAGAGAAGMALADKAEKVIDKAGSAISGLPEEKHEGSTWEAAKEGAKIGAGFEAVGQVGRAVGGPKVGAALQAASALGLLGTGAYEAVKSSEEEKSQAPLTEEEREFFRRNAHLFLDDSTRHPAYQRRRVKNSTDITDSE